MALWVMTAYRYCNMGGGEIQYWSLGWLCNPKCSWSRRPTRPQHITAQCERGRAVYRDCYRARLPLCVFLKIIWLYFWVKKLTWPLWNYLTDIDGAPFTVSVLYD